MKPDPNPLDRMLELARRAAPPVPPESAPPSVGDMAFLARRSFAAARRTSGTEDSWRDWLRAGRWSLAGATAVSVLVLVLQPASPPMANPFEPFTADTPTEETELTPRL